MLRGFGVIAGATIALLVVIALILNTTTLGRIYLPTGSGLLAKQLCSLTFVSGFDPDRARALYLDPLLGEAGDLMHVKIDEDAKTVTASVMGLAYRQHAAHRDGLGCTLVHDPEAFNVDLVSPAARDHQPLPLDTAHRDARFDPDALNAAVEAAFDPEDVNRRQTLAVVVLHEGRLVAERYATGVSAETPLHGWSMTKSLAATMAGVLVQRDLLDIDADNQIAALAKADPARADITVEHLLRMTGGLSIEERNDGTDPNSDMLFTEADMARFAATRARLHPPGAHWAYQSGDTVLAGSALQERMGSGLTEDVTALREWLFEPLNIRSAVLEADQAGTLQWSSYMYASAQDWARLAQLYLDDGRAGDAQIIPEDWLERVALPTSGSDGQYGMGFWINEPGAPDGAVIMRGFQDQWAFIVPDHALIVVRLGATNGGVDPGVLDLANGVVAALNASAAAAD